MQWCLNFTYQCDASYDNDNAKSFNIDMEENSRMMHIPKGVTPRMMMKMNNNEKMMIMMMKWQNKEWKMIKDNA